MSLADILGSVRRARVNVSYPIKPVAVVRREPWVWQSQDVRPPKSRRKTPLWRLQRTTALILPPTGTSRQRERWLARRVK